MLRPGTHVLRRNAAELQVGLDPRSAVVLDDEPPVRATLAALRTPGVLDPENPDVHAATLTLLLHSGHVVDSDALMPLVPAADGATPDRVRAERAALARSRGDTADEALRDRRECDIAVRAAGAPLAGELARDLVGLLAGAGVHGELAEDDATGGARRRRRRTTAGVLVVVGEPHREELDAWTREGTPHVLLRLTEGEAVLGPFVRPGITPCLRCLDAHHGDLDPAWPLLVRQYASACTGQRADSVPEPVDPLLAATATAWLARELVSFVDGDPPVTTATTIRLDARLTTLESQAWAVHPDCGCSWT